MWDGIQDLETAKRLILNPHYERTSDFSADVELLEMTEIDGLDVLDFGCGVGRNALHLINDGGAKSVTLFDHLNMLAMAKDHMGEDFRKVEAVLHPVDNLIDKKFDVIVACFVFQHIAPDVLDRSLKVLSECLSDGGSLLVHSRGYNDYGGNNWKMIAKHFKAVSPVDEDDDTENHQRVRFTHRDC